MGLLTKKFEAIKQFSCFVFLFLLIVFSRESFAPLEKITSSKRDYVHHDL